jgi:hypothetical protein
VRVGTGGGVEGAVVVTTADGVGLVTTGVVVTLGEAGLEVAVVEPPWTVMPLLWPLHAARVNTATRTAPLLASLRASTSYPVSPWCLCRT